MTDDTLELGRKRAEELGLRLNGGYNYVAEDIHRLLGEGQEAWASLDAIKNTPLAEVWYGDNPRHHTHKALLIGIRSIKTESPERALLREFASVFDSRDCGPWCDHLKEGNYPLRTSNSFRL